MTTILYHDCGQAVEEYVSKAGKFGEHTLTTHYPLKADGEPYKSKVAPITQCPNCRGVLYDYSLHKDPPVQPEPMEKQEPEDLPPPP
jgi:hypothetical protein